ncbi:MAG: cytochrome c oxidase assembly protein [Ahrensia sp.]
MSEFQKDTRDHMANRRVAIACVAFFSGMVGLAYASVPLYELFCQVTGYGGTTQRVETASETVLDKTITVRFDANTSGGLGWKFKPIDRQINVKIGEIAQASYRADNMSVESTGTATFNVTPQAAGAFFNKMECFCFTETTLASGEGLDMPVVFFVDPDIVNSKELKDINTITLSYTFFPVDQPETAAKKNKNRNQDSAGSAVEEDNETLLNAAASSDSRG